MRKKMMVIVPIVILFLLIIIVFEKKTGFMSIGYGKLNIAEEHIGVRCEWGPLVKYETDYNEDVKKFIEAVNEMEVREKDWLDVVLDVDTYDTTIYMGNTPYKIKFMNENGSGDILVVGVGGKGEITFNDTTYILKGKVPTYIMDRCSGKVGKEFKKIEVDCISGKSVTLTNKEDIEALEYLFDENCYNGKWDENGKDWIYKVTATEKDGDEVDVYVISTNLIKAPDGNVYEHSEGINVRGIDKITGIERK